MDADCDTQNTPQMKQQACERRYKCDLADTSVNFSEHVTVCSSVSEAGRQTDRQSVWYALDKCAHQDAIASAQTSVCV